NPGQSSLTVEAGPVVVGVATENQWWGPGIRNALVMSNNAGGIPHAFLRTRAPLRTRVGTFEGRLMAGALTESVFFDTLSGNDFRSLSGLALTYTPVWVPGLTAGFSRVVYAGVDGTGDLPGHALDVFGRVPEPEMTLTVHGDTVWFERPDQMLSLFARWVFPRDRLEVYAEWARRTPPASFRDWLAAPNHGQAYTLGSQWATPVRGDLLRFQAELSYLEQSTTFRQRRQDMYYASRSVRQGYTQRGQVVGAAIGPGASSQWVAGDWLARGWQAGVFAGRVRWENDAYYRVRTERFGRTGYDVGFLGHDVSVLGGLRGGVRLPWVDVSAELTRAKRFDYLFQNSSVTFTGEKAVDVHNTTLSLTLSTPAGRPLP
ncbi:MAG TPA: capsule assembly Wzi family protein, partial [Longimicrobiaceae bacterium]